MNRMKGILGIKKLSQIAQISQIKTPEGWRPRQPKDPEGWRPRQPRIELKCPENSGLKYKVSNILLFGYWKIFSWQKILSLMIS